MAVRARCQCGQVLTFRRGPKGSKVRCSACGATVRLRSGTKKRLKRRKLPCVCGTVILVARRVPAFCPSCNRPLADDRANAASAPLEGASRSTPTVPKRPERSEQPAPQQRAGKNRLKEIEAAEPVAGSLAKPVADPILDGDTGGPEAPTYSRLPRSYTFWLVVGGLAIVVLAAAAVLIIHLAGD